MYVAFTDDIINKISVIRGINDLCLVKSHSF